MPLSLVIEEGAPYQYGGIPSPVKSNLVRCPICQCGTVNGMQLLPMGFCDLDRAIELREQCAQAASESGGGKGVGKRSREDHEADELNARHIQAETASLLLSHAKSTGSRDPHHDRTGRWTSEEVAFVDEVVAAFDHGSLPLPHGVKLNEFLGEMLLCKSSRLTKKMKNAKLSTRSFTLHNTMSRLSDDQCVTLSSLQEKFLKSVSSEPVRLELTFNITKLWRTHFSNLCLQVGYELLDASDWVMSLEAMERRAADAEEEVRAVRRRRMGLALRQDVGPASTHGVFIGGLPANRGAIAPPDTFSSDSIISTTKFGAMKSDMADDQVDFLANVLEMDTGAVGNNRSRTLSEDFLIGFDDLEDPLNMIRDAPPQPVNKLGDCGPFLENVIQYVERENLPFEHADVWVPSQVPVDQNGDGKSETLRLFHAGHATRSDIESGLASQLHEYGVYSTNFSFAPGVGLPGRVYNSGVSSWENHVNDADPTRFERAGGAQVYGVKTAVGIPLDAPVVGRIVVALYGTNEIEENMQQLDHCATDFAKWIPEPKWKLVVELGQGEKATTTQGTPSIGAAVNVSSSSLSNDGKSVRNSSSDASYFGSQTLMGEQNDSGTNQEAMFSARGPPSEDEIEQRVATLLGDHMPLNENSGNDSMLQHFMQLRLLLLRSKHRRSQDENDLLDVIMNSFKGYSKDNRRVDSELAWLLARDWMFLSASNQQLNSPTVVVQQYSPLAQPQMTVPTVQPMRLMEPLQQMYPSMGTLSIGDPSKLVHWRHDSFDDRTGPKTDLLSGAGRSREVSPTVVPDG